ncbi:MAG: HAMP domain-containing histidine kinase [Bacteroidales bacterium]|nr:HAMP domain-containing histidine kinase [Bacteroidales bacterium]
MKLAKNITEWIAAALLVAGAVLFVSSLRETQAPGDTFAAARRVERAAVRRMALLDKYIDKALAQDSEQWMTLDGLPSDFVVYRYCQDTLQSWCNEFPVANDNINQRVYVPFLADPRVGAVSPLLQVTDSLGYFNFGSRWYLVKSVGDESKRVIAGMEVLDNILAGRSARVNRHLHLPGKYTIRPISASGGSPVTVEGRPQFKILLESIMAAGRDYSPLLWLAFFLILTAFLVYLSADRSLRRFRTVALGTLVIMAGFYLWGKFSQTRAMIFSPMLYAGGEVLYSLGAVILINLSFLWISLCAYMSRKAFWDWMDTPSRRSAGTLAGIVVIVLELVYSFFALKSIILNSGFSLELYKLSQLSPFCIVVYLSFLTMLMGIPLQLQLLKPAVEKMTGRRFDSFSLTNRVVWSVLVSVYLVSVSGVLGFRKEQDRLGLIANRLAFDRDISLELRLRRMESQIADDMILSALSHFQGTESAIQSRVADYYFSGSEREYLITVRVYNQYNHTRQAADEFNSILEDGVAIADDSRFLYARRENGKPYYVGVFFYLSDENEISRVLVRLESRETLGGRGYAGIFGITPPGQVSLPSGYSYARYSGRDLKAYRGRYPYPTRMDDRLYVELYGSRTGHFVQNGYRHFLNVVGEGEAVVISRARIGAMSYVVAGILVALIAFLMLLLVVLREPKAPVFQQTYFRSRISWVLLFSLLLTLLAMALVSVLFVYSRNDSNRQTVMSDKIGSIVTMMQAGLQETGAGDGSDWQAVHSLIERVGSETGSDITLYTPSGRLLMTTTPMIFDQLMVAERINGTAYYNIAYGNRRHFIQREQLGRQHFYSMYAPLFADNGSMLAILCSPYNEDTYDFEEDAVMHSLTILSLFLLFLLTGLFMASRIVDRMFKPLSEMSQKMTNADLGSLEYIEYDRDDEISSIVQAYNRMVTELSESSRKLAQAERDKAWSGMARQVAHEIKNPLTPMKLQLQRVIRLKQKGDPAWQTRFDEASQVILDHIDILTDTANEFSTFAKLYTEEPTEIALDQLLQEEITMFDNKENITFDYLGLADVRVQGPKPQLTRVFVNLLGNAVQAIGDAPDGRIIVSLRKSVADGFYDIVVEDNGPGVSDENIERLFTPNFTTKSGGSGLGLAISRSILERCGASIAYSRSFTLGGACFTVRYPV